MNNITQIKRGTTIDWSLGPEIVHFEDLLVNGKDSTIECLNTVIRMNVYTESMEKFYSNPSGSGPATQDSAKTYGLWIKQDPDNTVWFSDPAKSYRVQAQLYGAGITDCHLYGVLNGRVVELTNYPATNWSGASGEPKIWVSWPNKKSTTAEIKIKISVKEVDAGNTLAPGQLGVEYTIDNQPKLKIGIPGISNWKSLPYIGDTNTSNTNAVIPTTYAQLVELKNAKLLTPGTYYRITDYEATISATGYDSVRAAHANYFDIIVLALSNTELSEQAFAVPTEDLRHLRSTYIQDSVNKTLKADLIQTAYQEIINTAEQSYERTASDEINFLHFDYILNNTDERVPVIYSASAPDMVYFYDKTTTVDGYAYNRWRKIDQSTLNWDDEIQHYIYTNIIVPDTQSQVTAWEIKYCIDNDRSRFNWANPDFGKGVIYYLKDEYHNVCHYDFKNIVFNHNAEWQTEHEALFTAFGLTPGITEWFYTFSYVRNNLNIEDASSPKTINDTYDNYMEPAYRLKEADGGISLPFNLCLYTEAAAVDSFQCYSNYFGPDTHHNLLTHQCARNHFGINCHHNVLGPGSHTNIFEYGCNNNNLYANNQLNHFHGHCRIIKSIEAPLLGVTLGSNCSNIEFCQGAEKSNFHESCHDLIWHICLSNGTIAAGTSYHTFTADVPSIKLRVIIPYGFSGNNKTTKLPFSASTTTPIIIETNNKTVITPE